MATRLLAYLRGLVARRRVGREADEELQFHLDHEVEANRARGMSDSEARRVALRDLGGLTQTREAVQHVRATWLDAMWQDLRQAARRLVREPAYTVVAVLTLTLAVGANTAILSIADAVLFRPLPYAQPDRVFIIEILSKRTGQVSTMTPYSFVDAINDVGPDVSEVGMVGGGPRVTVTTADGPAAIPVNGVTSQYLSILGVTPVRGRVFGPQDAGREDRAAMLSYKAWQERFGGDETIVGKSVTVGTTTFDVVGVLPRTFLFPSLFVRTPPEIVTLMKTPPRGSAGGTFHAIVRIAPGVTRERAEAEIGAAISSVTATDPNWKDQSPVLEDIRFVLYGRLAAPIMRFLVASALLILLIGCANLANLLLVRGQRRTRDSAMRLALGASRGRLVRPMLLEALIMGTISAALAVLTTGAIFEALLRQVPPVAYGNAPVGVDLRVGVMALAMSLAGALVFAAVPAWRAARLDVLALLQGRREAARGRSSVGRPMLVVQVALSLVAVFGAVVAGRAFVDVLNTPLGFRPDNVVRIGVAQPRPPVDPRAATVVSVTPGKIEVTDPPKPAEEASAFYRRIVDALRSRPDVLSVGAITGLPLSSQAPYGGVQMPNQPANAPLVVGTEWVLPGVFETIGMSLVRGRFLTWDDYAGDRTSAVLSESAAKLIFPTREALGQVFVEGRLNRSLRVVGIVADARQSLDRVDPPRAYVFPTGSRGSMDIVVRTRTRNDATLTDLKATVRALATESTVGAGWWSDAIGSITAYRNPRFQTIVLVSLGALALTLTALGVFGVVNYLVASRTREMGVRIAIGATPARLATGVLRQAIVPVAIGLSLGLLVIRWMSPLAEAQLFKVNVHDPFTLAAASVVVMAAALAAAWIPARRAGRIDPVNALRSE